jgi:YD repeat-containing protein
LTIEYRFYGGELIAIRTLVQGKRVGDFAYQYDANGNMTKKGDRIVVNGVATAVKDVTADYWANVTDSTTGIDFDVTGGLFYEYEYDLLNRMIGVQRNGQASARYEYDEGGLLFRKTGSGGETTYTWSPNGKLLYEETGPSATPGESTYKRYIYVNGDLFAYEKGTVGSADVTRNYVHQDQVGSVTAITDSTGATVWAGEYSPYGELADKDNKPPDGMQYYAGHFYDADANLYYANA